MNKNTITAQVQQWIKNIVIGLNLCPFAKREFLGNSIRYSIIHATTEKSLLEDLRTELNFLIINPSTETSILIIANYLQDFLDYNQFLDTADTLLRQSELEGIIQIASFHPDYQFADSTPNAVENYTNRAPYPLLHLLREESIEQTIAKFPDTDKISENNIARLREIGLNDIQKLFTKRNTDNEI